MLDFIKNIFKKQEQEPKSPDNNKINLLIEVDSFDKGGLQKVILDQALLFDKEKINPIIVNINQAGFLGNLAKEKGITVYNLENSFNKAKKYAEIIKNERINLSCSHFSSFGYPILKSHKIPNITFIHNVYAFLNGPVLQKFKEDDKYVDLYISVSNKAAYYANKKLGISQEKIVTIPNGLIIEEHFEREKNAKLIKREDFGLSENDYVFLNVASYNLHKGHYLMVDAMKKILKTRNDIKILCIGNIIYPPHIEELTNYLKTTGLDKYIVMPGYFPNIESFYNIVDAFLLPSFIEGWSIAMNEAMFYKKPMILTDTGGSADVIENNDIGILLENEYGDTINLDSQILDNIGYNQKEFKTAEKLAEAMEQFADNKEYWKKAGEKGREKILKHYNFKDIMKKYEEILVSLLKKTN
jgi:glycosyltransferase involved in cell wall biosynthesis